MKSAIKHDAHGIVTTEAIIIGDAQTYSANGDFEDEPEMIECTDTESESEDDDTEDEDDFLPIDRDEPSADEHDDFEGAQTGITSKLDTTSGTLYLDKKLQCIKPNISMLATTKMNSWILDPASFVFSPAITYLSWIITVWLSGIWMAAHTTRSWWKDGSLSTKNSMLMSLVAVIIAACIAAIGI